MKKSLIVTFDKHSGGDLAEKSTIDANIQRHTLYTLRKFVLGLVCYRSIRSLVAQIEPRKHEFIDSGAYANTTIRKCECVHGRVFVYD